MSKFLSNKYFKKVLKLFLGLFLCMNIIACFHAYKFTHFSDEEISITKNPEKLSVSQKLSALVFGVNLPRPKNNKLSIRKFETIKIDDDNLECWVIEVENSKGTVLLFHGYGNKKSGMLDRAEAFYQLGYNTVLMDFSGSGGSKGNTTTIGFKEGNEVKICYDYFRQKYPTQKIILMGSSMGAAAIMKCLNDNNIQPSAIILECPFGSMYKTVCKRFEAMKVPSFPMAGLLVFYGGIMNGFWAFDHNPIDYAKKITLPTLLLSGGSDERVSQEEINAIYTNLQGKKQKIIYPKAKHESYLNDYGNEWNRDVNGFLEGN